MENKPTTLRQDYARQWENIKGVLDPTENEADEGDKKYTEIPTWVFTCMAGAHLLVFGGCCFAVWYNFFRVAGG